MTKAISRSGLDLICILIFRLSGLSPFGGKDDAETSENIKRCDLKFPSEFFSIISDNGMDFMKKLIIRNKQNRLNVWEALEHPWLLEETINDSARIPNSRYDDLLKRLKARYAQPIPALALGRSAGFSSLKKHYPKEYSIYSSFFDRRDAAPRFVLKPRNQRVMEGQSAEFKSIIVAPSQPLVLWFRDNLEIKQSFKHMKKYNRNTYALEIKKCVINDQGEYVVKASNSYGEKNFVVTLTVDSTYFFLLLFGFKSVVYNCLY